MTSQLLPPLSNIKHPLEGCIYLLIIALLFRFRWPETWNKFLKRVAAPEENDFTDKTD